MDVNGMYPNQTQRAEEKGKNNSGLKVVAVTCAVLAFVFAGLNVVQLIVRNNDDREISQDGDQDLSDDDGGSPLSLYQQLMSAFCEGESDNCVSTMELFDYETIVNSPNFPYQYISAFEHLKNVPQDSGAGALFYRAGADDRWKFVMSGNSVPACEVFRMRELQLTFADWGEKCAVGEAEVSTIKEYFTN
ncbi:MAG: hypothetical protein LBT19_03470 [Candidatus Nomurabacteria bacterium]|jgi:hypothetical protein|nr:hypothetical protein [Candidatus Nomurabacteria bacterium]